MSEVTITVSGPCGSGKSALLGEIEIMCKALSIPVRYADEKAAQGEKNVTHADWIPELEMYKPSVVLVEDMPWLRPSAAPVSGQGASVDPLTDEETPLLDQLRTLLEIETTEPYTVLTFALTRIRRLQAALDSRPRSEDSRAKEVAWEVCVSEAKGEWVPITHADYVRMGKLGITVRSLASSAAPSPKEST